MQASLRQNLVDMLLHQGFTLDNNQLVPPDQANKNNIRQLYDHLRSERLKEARRWLLSVEEKLLPYFANGNEVNVMEVRPSLMLVDNQCKADLFRYASLTWSVPVSAGYGRRMRFLILDQSNGKLVGIFALVSQLIAKRT